VTSPGQARDSGADLDRARARNIGKARAEADQGPARHEQEATPIGDAIEAFHERDDLSFGIPAHRSGRGGGTPLATRWTGAEAFRADVGMNKGVDTRHQSWKVEPTAMALFAEAVGADQTMFSTNGSTENVHVAMMAAVRPGESLVMARNGHKSAFSGLVLSGAMPIYVDPDHDPRWQVAHGVDPAKLDQALRDHPEAVAAMVFTPTYYGVSADVAGLADAAHAHGVPLLTDDAWGLDYSFSERLPPSALQSGADLTIGSVHKSLNGLCQTSVISRKGDRIDPDRLSLVFELSQSTSASPLLLSSIDAARHDFAHHGEELLGKALDLALDIRGHLTGISGIAIMGDQVLDSPGAAYFDPTHISIDVLGLGLTGFQAADWIQHHHGLHLELADQRRVMALITFADTRATATRLIDAITDLASTHAGRQAIQPMAAADLDALRMDTVVLPRDAFLGRTEMVPWREAAGRVAAEMICPYPPGIPVVAPGELLTGDVVDYLQQQVAAGAMVEGAADETLAELRVSATR
jgi:arginine decarboxylase